MNITTARMTKEQEHDTWTKYLRASGDTKTKLEQQLIEHHYPLVRNLARQHCFDLNHLDDAIQGGVLGLMMAIRRFDPSRGTKFASYARYDIRAQIVKAAQYAHKPDDEISLEALTESIQQNSETDTEDTPYLLYKAENHRDALDLKMIRDEVEVLVKQLPYNYRVAVSAYYRLQTVHPEVLAQYRSTTPAHRQHNRAMKGLRLLRKIAIQTA